jgi:hypothetical protein
MRTQQAGNIPFSDACAFFRRGFTAALAVAAIMTALYLVPTPMKISASVWKIATLFSLLTAAYLAYVARDYEDHARKVANTDEDSLPADKLPGHIIAAFTFSGMITVFVTFLVGLL